MSIRRQLYKEADFTSDDNEQKADFLKTNRRVLFLLSAAAIIIVTITLLSWQTWRSYKHLRRTEIQLMQINSIENSVMYRNEMLTISAMMTAVTINSEWENRYRDFGPRAEAAIKDIRDVFGSNTTDAENAEEGLRVFVDDKLDIMENEALELVSRRKYKDAAALLQSPEYEEQKQAYNSGMKEFISNARSVLTERRDSHHQKALGTFTAVNIILLVIGITWLVLYKKRNRPHKHKETKQEFDVSAQQWHKTFNAITDGVCIVDKEEGKILQCNSAMTRFLKRPYDEIIGGSCCELLHNSSEPVKRCPLVRMYESGRSETKDFEIGDKWLNIKVDPLIDNDGNLVGAVHIISDITEQKKADRAIQDSENKFRLAFANAQDAIVWIDVGSGVITNCNKAAEELFERGRKEIVGQHHTTLYPEENAEHYHNLLFQGRS